ncbi:MAG: type 4a pilus biogenesis protein PilO [Nitrospiraceae bacterium]|nr:type 4a pilus biogenesis protein PilO [Nitrospiraceae bacterium]
MMEFFKGTVTPKDWMAAGGILGFTALLCVAFYFLLYGPQTQIFADVVAEDRQVQADLDKARDTQANIKALRAEAAMMETLVSQFEERLPEKSEIPRLLRQFEEIARDVGLRVELAQLPAVRDATKITIPYTVTARGSFHEIASFINRLERYKRYLKVSDLDIGEQKLGVAEASFTLSTYRFAQTEEGDPS